MGALMLSIDLVVWPKLVNVRLSIITYLVVCAASEEEEENMYLACIEVELSKFIHRLGYY